MNALNKFKLRLAYMRSKTPEIYTKDFFLFPQTPFFFGLFRKVYYGETCDFLLGYLTFSFVV